MKAIWIIDDDKSIRWVFEKALARTDLNFKTFSSIKDALHVIKNEEPQVIVSDIRMPQGSGLGLSLAQTYISQHMGMIECKSQPGRTVFTILLPIKDHDAKEFLSINQESEGSSL